MVNTPWSERWLLIIVQSSIWNFLTNEEEKAAYAEQVRKGQAALASAIAGTGFSPVKVLKRKRDDDGDEDEDGDLIRF